MIELTEEQAGILQKNDEIPPYVVNPKTQEEFVLVRRALYERLRAFLDEELTTEDAFHTQIESAAAAGWDDPALDVYNAMELRKS
jgi:hypothetical protein